MADAHDARRGPCLRWEGGHHWGRLGGACAHGALLTPPTSNPVSLPTRHVCMWTDLALLRPPFLGMPQAPCNESHPCRSTLRTGAPCAPAPSSGRRRTCQQRSARRIPPRTLSQACRAAPSSPVGGGSGMVCIASHPAGGRGTQMKPVAKKNRVDQGRSFASLVSVFRWRQPPNTRELLRAG